MDLILLASVIAAVIGGVANQIDYINESDKEYNSLNAEKKRVEEAYTLQKKQAEDEYKAAQDNAERTAQKNVDEANIADLGADISEKSISNDFNTAIDQLYLNQANDTWNWNNAAMQAGTQTGAGYANLAASGVRAGSSLSNAVLMESATNAAQLQFSQDATRRNDNNNLASVLNGLAGNKLGIYQDRYLADSKRMDAWWLRTSYKEGGNSYNLYQDQLNIMDTKKNQELARIKEKQDDINENRQLKLFTSFFTGASKGAATGYKASTAFYEAQKYDG